MKTFARLIRRRSPDFPICVQRRSSISVRGLLLDPGMHFYDNEVPYLSDVYLLKPQGFTTPLWLIMNDATVNVTLRRFY